MFSSYPGIATCGRRIHVSTRPSRRRNTLPTRRAADIEAVEPVIRVVGSAYVLPGQAAIYRRLQDCPVYVFFGIPPYFHRKQWIYQAAEVKARTCHLRVLFLVVVSGKVGNPGVRS